MQDLFDQKKNVILKEILSSGSDNPDASPKGTIDQFCIPIIDLINSKKDFVTTSSCSGRLSVFLEGIKIGDKIGAKGNQGRWIFVSHDPKEITNWYDSIDFEYSGEKQLHMLVNSSSRYILYKFEPLILHIKCRDFESANKLYQCAMGCGFRESGIGSNNVVAIRISIRLDIPIGYQDNDGRLSLFVNKEYLKFITQLSADRFRENFKKMDQLYQAIEKLDTVSDTSRSSESKAERRERKIIEGLARKEELRQLKERAKEQEARQ
ncbi:uncharacterized protein PRCAT00003104001 [Priceomyces carsonii]|uniref:uncharacterized protein n=1 Tax=Priceomyces carsonii TaxID=28549 RepID=UPI002ED8F193|nr:unnamed protein product [Priceomyces carsonii]